MVEVLQVFLIHNFQHDYISLLLNAKTLMLTSVGVACNGNHDINYQQIASVVQTQWSQMISMNTTTGKSSENK